MTQDSIVILSARRTPVGAFQGAFASVKATELGTAAIRGAIEASGLTPADVQEVIMGCVLPAGLGQGPARQAALGAGLPNTVPATTINKLCGSAMKAIMMAADSLRTGDIDVAVAGGLESMTNAPYLLLKARSGYRMGHGEILDHMFYDGLQSPFDGKAMGCFADATSAKYGFTREMQDAFATESVKRSLHAVAINRIADTTTVALEDPADVYILDEITRAHVYAEARSWGIPGRGARTTIDGAIERLEAGMAAADELYPELAPPVRAKIRSHALRFLPSRASP